MMKQKKLKGYAHPEEFTAEDAMREAEEFRVFIKKITLCVAFFFVILICYLIVIWK